MFDQRTRAPSTPKAPPQGPVSARVGLKQRWVQLQGRMLFLLVTLVLLIFIRPFFSEQSVLLGFFLAALLLGTLYAISRGDRRVFIIAVALGGPHVGAIWLGRLVLGNVGYLIGVVFGLLFYGFVALILLRYILRAPTVTADMLYGAASVYFLLGLVWAMAFVLVEMQHPGSLSIERPGPLAWDDFMYYSFVTLTTLGYGDITPLTQSARSLAILEAITGVFYTTMLVARLVGLYLVQLTLRQTGNEQP